MEMMIDRIKPGKSAQCTDVETLHEEFSQAMNDNDENLETRDEEKSVLWLHSVHHHQGRVDVTYRMRTTGSYTEPLDRQLQERVNITSFKGPILMNRRNGMGGLPT